MDRPKANQLRRLVETALGEILKNEKVTLQLKGGTFTSTNFKFSIVLTDKVEGQKDVPPEEAEFRKHHALFGLQLTDLHRKITIPNGRKMILVTITGLLPKGQKNVISVVTEDGTGYRVPLDMVKAGLERANKSPDKPKAKREESVILTDLRNVLMDLEPENLAEDGEASAAVIARKQGVLERRKEELIQELGRTPTDREIWHG